MCMISFIFDSRIDRAENSPYENTRPHKCANVHTRTHIQPFTSEEPGVRDLPKFQ